MRIWCCLLAVGMIALAQGTSWAQARDKAEVKNGLAKQAAMLKQMAAKFDLDGDGNVDDEEKAKAAEELQKRLQDGKLSAQEAALIKQLMAQLQAGGGQPQFGAGGGGGGGLPGFGGPGFGGSGGDAFSGQVPPDVLKKFDKNKNGQLDEAEKKAAMAALGPKKSRKEQLLEKLDLNGDGKVTKEEKEQVAAQRKAEQEEKKAEAEEKKAKAKKKADDKDKDKIDEKEVDEREDDKKEGKAEKDDKTEKDDKDEK